MVERISIAQMVVNSFLNNSCRKREKFRSTGDKLYIYEQEIARKIDDNIMEIRTANYASPTLKRFLNRLPGVHVYHRKFQLYLNGNPWDGDWIIV
jgi:hypothetical protein